MKRILRQLLIITSCIISAFLLMAPGCEEGEKNVGYHSVIIPGFEEADYLLMLNSPNEEMQYNAICYFYKPDAYDQYLTTDSLKGTARYDTALEVYRKIYQLIQSKNTWVSSAAIRVIGEFNYNKGAFLSSLLSNSNPSLNVQLEIIRNLRNDTAKDQAMLIQKINFLQQQPSWLLQNGSYQLIGKNDSTDYNQLIKAYNVSNEAYKKLLILNVLAWHVTDTVFSFLTKEYIQSPDERIKEIIFSSLVRAKNQALVVDWFSEHYNLLEENMKGFLYGLYEEDNKEACTRLIVLALDKGWKPTSLLVEKINRKYGGEPLLYITLFEIKHEEYTSDSIQQMDAAVVKRIEDALLKIPPLNKEWVAFEKRMMPFPLPPDFIHQHRQLTEDYLVQTQSLLNQYKIDTSIYNDFINYMNQSAKEMYEKKTIKSE